MMMKLSENLTDEERKFLAGQGGERRRYEPQTCKHNFGIDLGANVAGNAIYDTALWVIKKMIRR